nr:hypothetical protein [Pandoravirus belohorizontensis]
MARVASRAVAVWGAMRDEAYLTLLAADRPGSVAYALDRRSFVWCTAPPARYGDSHPAKEVVASYELQHRRHNGHQLGCDMIQVAARRCTVETFEAVVATASAWGVWDHCQHCKPITPVRPRNPCALMSRRFRESVLAFDRADIQEMTTREYGIVYPTEHLIIYNAARCLSHQMAVRYARCKGDLSMRVIHRGVDGWSYDGLCDVLIDPPRSTGRAGVAACATGASRSRALSKPTRPPRPSGYLRPWAVVR